MTMTQALSWEQLAEHAVPELDRVNGPANAQANLRLFGQPESAVRVTLYRDLHAWCPYCQKIWLWLEFKRIPYRIRKVTMRCYGAKEPWYLAQVPSGMLPALELDGELITESDVILLALERRFGPLGMPLESEPAMEHRQLERLLFRAWCLWLCSPGLNRRQQGQAREQFRSIAQRFERALSQSDSPWLEPTGPSSVDLVFVPYVERMNASLAYYKGYRLRQAHPAIDRWFRALEALETYRGTQSDFHTHVHDLPPQMGGCWSDDTPMATSLAEQIDLGVGLLDDEAHWPESARDDALMRRIALSRVLKHRIKLLANHPSGASEIDQPIRAALTTLITQHICLPSPGSAAGLRYLRDRISSPRDMPLMAARVLRQALEATAHADGPSQGAPIPVNHRFDQDPRPFQSLPT